MKLSDYAKKVGVTYKTAYRWFKAGRLRGELKQDDDDAVSGAPHS
jgi:predicted site-specific integrase-resolvase